MNHDSDYFAMYVGILYFEMYVAILGAAFKTRNRSEACLPISAGNHSSGSETTDFVCSEGMPDASTSESYCTNPSRRA